MSSFEGKVVLVTGGTRGIGRACAERFAQGEARVAICGRDDARVEEAAQAIGNDAKGYACDVADGVAVAALIAQCAEELGPIQILVNNAGITRDNLLLRLKEEDWDQVIDTDLKSIYRVTKACIKGMTKARKGRVINITSVVGASGNPGQSNYAAAKAGAVGFTKSLAAEVAARGITVNAVAPGFIDTDMTSALGEDQRAKLLEAIPLARLGRADDISKAVAFLVSDDASYITGQVLHVNGGMHMSS